MLTTYTRPLTQDEKSFLTKQLPSLANRLTELVVKFVFLLFCLLIPVFLIDEFFPIPQSLDLWLAITLLLLAAYITYRWTKSERSISIKQAKADIKNGYAVVTKVHTMRAVRREEYEDFGPAYYIDVTVEGSQNVLYLWGQYLDDLEYENEFPNTAFEIIRWQKNNELIDLKVSGIYFLPERKLAPFSKEVWDTGSFPLDGEILSTSIDNII